MAFAEAVFHEGVAEEEGVVDRDSHVVAHAERPSTNVSIEGESSFTFRTIRSTG